MQRNAASKSKESNLPSALQLFYIAYGRGKSEEVKSEVKGVRSARGE